MKASKVFSNIFFFSALLALMVALHFNVSLFEAKKDFAADVKAALPLQAGRLIATDYDTIAADGACYGAAYKLPPREFDKLKTMGLSYFNAKQAWKTSSAAKQPNLSCLGNLQDYLIRKNLRLTKKTKYYYASVAHDKNAALLVVPEWRLVIYTKSV